MSALRAITRNPDGLYRRTDMLHRDLVARLAEADHAAKLARTSDDERDWAQAEALEKTVNALYRELEAKRDEVKAGTTAHQGKDRTRALFLSATPFDYEKTIDWAKGYLFDYNEGRASDAYRESVPSAGTPPAVLARRASSGVNMEQFPGAVNAPDAAATVARIVSELGFAAKSAVVESFHDLPQAVQADARNQGADEDGVKGLLHDGVLYVVRRNVSSIAGIEETVFHEALGHYGLRKLLGPEFVQKTNALFSSLGGIDGLSAIAHKRGFGKVYGEYVRGVAALRRRGAKTRPKGPMPLPS